MGLLSVVGLGVISCAGAFISFLHMMSTLQISGGRSFVGACGIKMRSNTKKTDDYGGQEIPKVFHKPRYWITSGEVGQWHI